MPLEKWVGRFLIDEGERLLTIAEEMRMQYVSHQARNILLRVAAIREKTRQGTNQDRQQGHKQGKTESTRRGHWRPGGGAST